jgi:hypothetical protein
MLGKEKKNLFQFVLALAILIVFLFAMIYLKNTKIQKINSFEKCMEAGYPIMEIYPPICMTPDGRSFTQELSDEEKKNLLPPNDNNICEDNCGDNVCQEVVCESSGCPCAESSKSCPNDCK